MLHIRRDDGRFPTEPTRRERRILVVLVLLFRILWGVRNCEVLFYNFLILREHNFYKKNFLHFGDHCYDDDDEEEEDKEKVCHGVAV